MLRTILIAVVSATPIVAQSSTVVFPVDRTTTEGSTNNIFPLGRSAMRYQQLELQAKGRSFAVRGIEFRRDGISNSAMPARALTATILVGGGDTSSFTTVFNSNWVSGPTTVVNAQSFNLPALPKPTSPPAPFSIKLPFAVPTAHNGQNALLWEVVQSSRDLGRYVSDAHRAGTVVGTFRTLGQGCTTSGTARFTQSTSFRATLAQTELQYGVTRAPANAPCIMLVGAANPDLQLPGVCTKLYAVPVVSILLGTSNSAGSVASQWFQLGPWNPTWAGAKLYSQGFAPDRSQPAGFVLSQGRELTLPSTDPQPIAQHRLYSTNRNASFGTLNRGFGLVVRFP